MYSGILEASVLRGTDPKTQKLSVELRGEGTLPHLTVTQPTTLDEDSGNVLLNFPRIFLGRSKTMSIVLRNEGIVPATARFDCTASECFAFSGLNKMITVEPGKTHNLDVTFSPNKQGKLSGTVTMHVLSNDFEATTFQFDGEGYKEDITLEGGETLPTDSGVVGDLLAFGDVACGVEVMRTVTLVNHSNTPYRFEWDKFLSEPTGVVSAKGSKSKTPAPGDESDEKPNFSFSPMFGHVQPGLSKEITIAFKSENTTKHDKVTVKCNVTKIRYLSYEERIERARAELAVASGGAKAGGKGAKGKTPVPLPSEDEVPVEQLGVEKYDISKIDWDESMKVSKWVPVDEPGAEASEEGASTPKMQEVFEIATEPAYEAVETQEAGGVAVALSAAVDRCSYDCVVESVNFKPTMMYQVREFKFPFKNTSTIALHYNWNIDPLDPNVNRPSRLGIRKPVEYNDDGEELPDKPEYQPFSITPASGSIPPGTEETFSIKFAPVEARPYSTVAKAAVDYLVADLQQPEIKLSAIAQRPKCHFELVNSDYITAGRRNAALPGPGGVPGPLDKSYRVLEFKSLGTKVRNTRRFYVVNPTNVSYAFEWTCDAENEAFRCNTPRGIVESGRKYEMVFEYVPEVETLVESFWRFEIIAHGMSIPFLLVGDVTEPEVKLDTPFLNFNELMIGRKLTEKVYIINSEHIPFAWSVNNNSFAGSGGKPVVDVVPSSGVVGPESRMPINVTFRPDREVNYNYMVDFEVKKKPGKVALNVKGEGFAIRPTFMLKDNNVSRELYLGEPNVIDFERVHVFETRVKQVIISNSGKFNFNYQWNLPKNKYVTISPLTGTVPRGGKGVCEIKYYTSKEASVENLKAVCTVANSKQLAYTVLINGRGKRPHLEFSSLKLDYGKCFATAHDNSGMLVEGEDPHLQTRIIKIVNKESTESVAVDMKFDKKPHLDVDCSATVLGPGETLEVPFKFLPNNIGAFHEVVPFEINGLYDMEVLVTGEGIPLKVELQDAAHSNIHFGNVREGHSLTRHIALVNHSKKSVNLQILRPKPQTANLQVDRFLQVSPPIGTNVTIRPRDVLKIDLAFIPQQRMPAFAQDLYFDILGTKRRLCSVSGACHGLGMKLDMDHLPFGNVVQNSSLTKNLKVQNTGDIGCKYTFPDVGPYFKFAPREGFIAAHQQVTVDVSFAPTELGNDIRYDRLPVLVDGVECDSMYLTLSGSSVPQPMEGVEELKFETKVRSSIKNTVQISNPTESRWVLHPIIQNSFWQGESPEIEVPANGSAEYTLVYTPLSMTSEDVPDEDVPAASSKAAAKSRPETAESRPATTATSRAVPRPNFHEGTLFIPLPIGSALAYKLIGYSKQADPVGTIQCEASCKKPFVQSLVVKNWLNSYQRFKVIIESEDKDPSVSITGTDTIDVPAMLERKFKLGFYAYKEGKTTTSVTFLNESTGEAMMYIVEFTATKQDSCPNLSPMTTPVRVMNTQQFVITNPLDIDATFQDFACVVASGEGAENPSDKGGKGKGAGATDLSFVTKTLTITDFPFTVPAKGSYTVNVGFRPLLPHDPTACMIKLVSDSLGDFCYNVSLEATATGLDSSMKLLTSLGSEITRTYRFKSFSTVATTYDISTGGDSEFIVDTPKLQAPAAEAGSEEGVELSFNITYEPSNIGQIRDQLKIASPEGGTYLVGLTGICDPPVPRGPVIIKANGQGVIKFKNVLDTAEDFRFAIDNPAFTLAKKTEKINRKSPTQINVSFKPTEGTGRPGSTSPRPGSAGSKSQISASPDCARMLITCPALPGVMWVYYLQGSKD